MVAVAPVPRQAPWRGAASAGAVAASQRLRRLPRRARFAMDDLEFRIQLTVERVEKGQHVGRLFTETLRESLDGISLAACRSPSSRDQQPIQRRRVLKGQ